METVGAAEIDAHCRAFDDQVVAVVVADRERADRIVAVGHAFGDGERLGCRRPQRELLVGHAVIGCEQRFGVAEAVFHVEQQFSVGGQRFGVERQHDGGGLLRGDAQVGDDAAAHGVPVAEHRPAQVAVVERPEEVFIENRQRAPVFAERGPHTGCCQ